MLRGFLNVFLCVLALSWAGIAVATDSAQLEEGEATTDSPSLDQNANTDSEAVDDGEDADIAPPLSLPMSLEDRFRAAEWVSMVKIEGIGALINPTLSQSTNFTVVQAYSYSSAVLKDWKGTQPEQIKFRVDLTDCKEPLKREGEYVVFGVINNRGGYQSMSCDDLIFYNQDEALLQTLDQFSLTQLASHP